MIYPIKSKIPDTIKEYPVIVPVKADEVLVPKVHNTNIIPTIINE